MYSYDEIRLIHLEVTTGCNAKCPMCPRTTALESGKPLRLQEISLDEVKEFLPEAFIKRLGGLYMCGNYGDPAAGSDTLEIFQYLRKVNPAINLGIHTNGGLRRPEWWRELAKTVNYCRFGIDGLEDTNHLYRRGTKWNTIIENVRAFVAANGGRAEWDYIVFKHNEHQVEDAATIANKLGFTRFRLKNTARFRHAGADKSAVEETRLPVKGLNGLDDYYLEIPTNPLYVNPAYAKELKLKSRYGSMESYFDSVEISCKVTQDKSVYISASGHAFPCCWLADESNDIVDTGQNGEISQLLKNNGLNLSALSLRHSSLEKIVNGPVMQTLIVDSWNKKLSQGKLKRCARVCGKDLDAFTAQFQKWQEFPTQKTL